MSIWTDLAEQHGAPKGLTLGQAIAYLDKQPCVDIIIPLKGRSIHDVALVCQRYCDTPGVREVACTRQEFAEAQTWTAGEWLVGRGILYARLD